MSNNTIVSGFFSYLPSMNVSGTFNWAGEQVAKIIPANFSIRNLLPANVAQTAEHVWASLTVEKAREMAVNLPGNIKANPGTTAGVVVLAIASVAALTMAFKKKDDSYEAKAQRLDHWGMV